MAGLRVLVADGDRKFLERAKKALTGAGYEVAVATSTEEALAAFSKASHDAVLASQSLPGAGGFALCRAVKVEVDPTIPCVILADEESTEVRSATAECGAENYFVRPIKDRELLFIARDLATIHHLKQRLVEVRTDSSRDQVFDPMTGFHTFSYFKEVLFIEVKRARRYGYPVSLLLVSYDHGPGVPEGKSRSEILKRLFGGLAVAIKKCMRDYDVAVSYGERDVLVLMPHTDQKGALVVARRIRDAISRSALKFDGTVIRPTVSVGVSSSDNGKIDSFSDMVREAKRALDTSHRRGGNAVAEA